MKDRKYVALSQKHERRYRGIPKVKYVKVRAYFRKIHGKKVKVRAHIRRILVAVKRRRK